MSDFIKFLTTSGSNFVRGFLRDHFSLVDLMVLRSCSRFFRELALLVRPNLLDKVRREGLLDLCVQKSTLDVFRWLVGPEGGVIPNKDFGEFSKIAFFNNKVDFMEFFIAENYRWNPAHYVFPSQEMIDLYADHVEGFNRQEAEERLQVQKIIFECKAHTLSADDPHAHLFLKDLVQRKYYALSVAFDTNDADSGELCALAMQFGDVEGLKFFREIGCHYPDINIEWDLALSDSVPMVEYALNDPVLKAQIKTELLFTSIFRYNSWKILDYLLAKGHVVSKISLGSYIPSSKSRDRKLRELGLKPDRDILRAVCIRDLAMLKEALAGEEKVTATHIIRAGGQGFLEGLRILIPLVKDIGQPYFLDEMAAGGHWKILKYVHGLGWTFNYESLVESAHLNKQYQTHAVLSELQNLDKRRSLFGCLALAGKGFAQSFFEKYLTPVDLFVFRTVSKAALKFVNGFFPDLLFGLRREGLFVSCIRHSTPEVFAWISSPQGGGVDVNLDDEILGLTAVEVQNPKMIDYLFSIKYYNFLANIEPRSQVMIDCWDRHGRYKSESVRDVQAGCLQAIERRDWQAVLDITKKNVPDFVYRVLFEKQFYEPAFSTAAWQGLFVVNALAYDDRRALAFVIDKIKTDQYRPQLPVISKIIATDHVDFLELIGELMPAHMESMKTVYLTIAISFGSGKCLDYLLQIGGELPPEVKCLQTETYPLSLVKKLADSGCHLTTVFWGPAFRSGNREFVRYLYESGVPLSAKTLRDTCALNCRVAFEFFLGLDLMIEQQALASSAALHGNWKLIRYMRSLGWKLDYQNLLYQEQPILHMQTRKMLHLWANEP